MDRPESRVSRKVNLVAQPSKGRSCDFTFLQKLLQHRSWNAKDFVRSFETSLGRTQVNDTGIVSETARDRVGRQLPK
jgi:hypothetical protein